MGRAINGSTFASRRLADVRIGQSLEINISLTITKMLIILKDFPP